MITRVIAVFIFFILLPIILLISLLVILNLGKPIFFIQERSGLQGKAFKVYKFRSMKNIYDANGKILPDEDRLFFFGKLLRKTSLDELPSIINVIKGDMNFIGPRPLLLEYNDKYSINQRKRISIKPGMTGWAQVNGRNSISWEEKFDLDIWYIENRNLMLDFKIVIFTLYKVISFSEVNTKENKQMPKFEGTRNENK